MEKKKNKLIAKAISIGAVVKVIDTITKIINQFEVWNDLWRHRRLKKKKEKLFKEAEKALRDRDVKKINEIIHR